MTNLTIDLPEDLHERLRALAARRGTSIDKLIVGLSTRAVAQADAEARLLSRAAHGDRPDGPRLPDKLDAFYRQT